MKIELVTTISIEVESVDELNGSSKIVKDVIEKLTNVSSKKAYSEISRRAKKMLSSTDLTLTGANKIQVRTVSESEIFND